MTNNNTSISLLRIDSVKARTGLGRSTVYKMIADGQFPQPVKISTRAVAWRSNEIDSWIDARVASY